MAACIAVEERAFQARVMRRRRFTRRWRRRSSMAPYADGEGLRSHPHHLSSVS